MSRQQAQAPKSTGAKPKQVNFNMKNLDLNFVFSEIFFYHKAINSVFFFTTLHKWRGDL